MENNRATESAARAYRATHLEGGEGYNPYEDRVKIERPTVRYEGDILHDLERIGTPRDGALGAEDTAKIAELRAELDAMRACE